MEIKNELNELLTIYEGLIGNIACVQSIDEIETTMLPPIAYLHQVNIHQILKLL
jgi:hypothetical protein